MKSYSLAIAERVLLGLLFALCTFTASASETVTIGAEDDWTPFSSKGGEGAKGFAVDIVRESFKAAGVEVKFETMPYARCMNIAKSGEIAACFNTARNRILDKDFLWHTKPLFSARINIYAPVDSTESGLTTKSLEGKTVGVTNGYEYGDEFDANTRIKREVARQDELGFKKVLAKRTEYMIAYEKVANAIFLKNKELKGKFKVVGIVAEPGLFIAFSKKHPDGAKFVTRFNEGYEAILKNGKYQAIESQWR